MTSTVDQTERELISPTSNLIAYAFRDNHFRLLELIRGKYHRKVRKIHHKYLNGQRNAEGFARFKVYRFLLLPMSEQ